MSQRPRSIDRLPQAATAATSPWRPSKGQTAGFKVLRYFDAQGHECAYYDTTLLFPIKRRKHYTSICNSAPSELLAAIALRNGERIRKRNRDIIAENLPRFTAFLGEWRELFEFEPPAGGCVCFPRYVGADGVEAMCRDAVEQAGVLLLLPASVYMSELAPVPTDRFRIGVGRDGADEALSAFDAFLRSRSGAATPARS